MSHRRAGFTLIELLVVVSIIVILLALLVGGLEKALKAAERSKCASSQRNITQQLAAYSLESDRSFPNSTGASPTGGATQNVNDPNASVNTRSDRLAFSMDYRSSDPTTGRVVVPVGGVNQNTEQDLGAQNGRVALGLGILVVNKRLAETKLGEIANCPSLDTSSAAPSAGAAAATVKFGMDEVHTEGVGGSGWVDPAYIASRVVGSYYYRGTSSARTRGGSTLRYNQAGKSGFVLTSDFFDRRYGIRFHHQTGYNVGYGDGHASFVADENDFLEKIVIGNEAQFKGPAGFPNNQAEAPINGYAKPGADEAAFNYLGTK